MKPETGPQSPACIIRFLCNSLILSLITLFALPAWGAERYVDPAHPQAQNAGDGHAGRPYSTLAYAISQLQPGDTLHIADGTYREALIFPKRKWSRETPTLVKGSKKVKILGTDIVNGWKRISRGIYVQNGWKTEPQQVIVKGTMLTQLGGTIFNGYPALPGHDLAGLHRSEGGIWPRRMAGSLASMPLNSFYYDKAHQKLYLRLNRESEALEPDTVEVAVRTYLVQGEGVSGIVLEDMRFQYSNTSTISRQGAVTLMGNGNQLINIVVEDADGAGIEIEGDHNQIRGCVVTRAGYLGIKARGNHNLISRNRVTYNNVRGFNKWWEAGGMKFIGDDGLKHSRVEENEVTHNYGDGIWFDWGNDDNQIIGNTVAYNTGFGIHYEASARAYIFDNRVFGNGQRGIYLPHSRDSVVKQNMVAANGLEGIVAIDEHRRDEEGRLDLHPRNNRIVGNILAWNKGPALILPGPQYHNQSDGNVYISSTGDVTFSMGWPSYWQGKKPLSQWREENKQDLKSVHFTKHMSKAMLAALRKEKVNINWEVLEQYLNFVTIYDSNLSVGEAHSRSKGH